MVKRKKGMEKSCGNFGIYGLKPSPRASSIKLMSFCCFVLFIHCMKNAR